MRRHYQTILLVPLWFAAGSPVGEGVKALQDPAETGETDVATLNDRSNSYGTRLKSLLNLRKIGKGKPKKQRRLYGKVKTTLLDLAFPKGPPKWSKARRQCMAQSMLWLAEQKDETAKKKMLVLLRSSSDAGARLASAKALGKYSGDKDVAKALWEKAEDWKCPGKLRAASIESLRDVKGKHLDLNRLGLIRIEGPGEVNLPGVVWKVREAVMKMRKKDR